MTNGELLQIAKIDLVFDNSEMIALLLKRGQAIKRNDKAQIFQLEHLINLKKQEMANVPVIGAFVTFQTWQDVKLAIYSSGLNFKIFDRSVSLHQANEPSNYIWENLGNSIFKRGIGLMLAIMIMTLFIFVAYRI